MPKMPNPHEAPFVSCEKNSNMNRQNVIIIWNHKAEDKSLQQWFKIHSTVGLTGCIMHEYANPGLTGVPLSYSLLDRRSPGPQMSSPCPIPNYPTNELWKLSFMRRLMLRLCRESVLTNLLFLIQRHTVIDILFIFICLPGLDMLMHMSHCLDLYQWLVFDSRAIFGLLFLDCEPTSKLAVTHKKKPCCSWYTHTSDKNNNTVNIITALRMLQNPTAVLQSEINQWGSCWQIAQPQMGYSE